MACSVSLLRHGLYAECSSSILHHHHLGATAHALAPPRPPRPRRGACALANSGGGCGSSSSNPTAAAAAGGSLLHHRHHHHHLASPPPAPATAAGAVVAAAAAADSVGGGGGRQQQQQPLTLGWRRGFQGEYQLGAVLGRGAFATTFAATHRATGAAYAVKVLRKSRGGSSNLSGSSSNGADDAAAALGVVDAIRAEADGLLAAQGSVHVARVEALYEDDLSAYIVQELCGGGDLRGLLAASHAGGRRLAEEQARDVARGVLDALRAVHAAGLAFGDLKPANVLLSLDATATTSSSSSNTDGGGSLHVRLVDFGAATPCRGGGGRTAHAADGDAAAAAHRREERLARSGARAAGTPLYSAPETAAAWPRPAGAAADVWSCGVLLYEVLTGGRLPFWRGKTLGDVARLPPYEVLAAVRNNAARFDDAAAWAGVSPRAQALVARMLERNPAARVMAAEALRDPWFDDEQQQQQPPQQQQPATMAAANNAVAMRGRALAAALPLVPAVAAD